MDKILVKNIIILSLILGVILGVLAPIPVLGMVMLFGMLLFAAPIVMVYLIMDGKLDLTTPKDSILTGALIGFCSNITFAIAYCTIMAILSQGFGYTTNFFLTAMIVNSPIWIMGLFIIFVGVLFAVTNAFTGFSTYYIINLIRDIYESRHPQSYENKDDLR